MQVSLVQVFTEIKMVCLVMLKCLKILKPVTATVKKQEKEANLRHFIKLDLLLGNFLIINFDQITLSVFALYLK